MVGVTNALIRRDRGKTALWRLERDIYKPRDPQRLPAATTSWKGLERFCLRTFRDSTAL